MKNRYILVSVIGSHAGEEVAEIFSRKQKEISNVGAAYWLFKSFKASTALVQAFCKQAEREHEPVYCLFITPSAKGGARPTQHESEAKEISADGLIWAKVPKGARITGKIDAHSTALVLDKLRVIERPQIFDLWEYSEFNTGNPIRLQLGASTVCCEQSPSVGMRSRYRDVVATGKLCAPYAVSIRG